MDILFFDVVYLKSGVEHTTSVGALSKDDAMAWFNSEFEGCELKDLKLRKFK